MIGASRISPLRFSYENEFFPPTATILKALNQRRSNFPCFPAYSFLASHFNTKSLGRNSLCLVFFIKKSFHVILVFLELIIHFYYVLLYFDDLIYSSRNIVCLFIHILLEFHHMKRNINRKNNINIIN